MDNAVAVAIVEGTRNLTAELAGLLLLELAVRDDVVEHLTTVDILEEHVPVVICPHNVSHAANVGVVEEGDDGSLASCSDLFGLVSSLLIGAALVAIIGGTARNDLAGDL